VTKVTQFRLDKPYEDCYNRANDNERKKMDEFDFFIDHEAGFDCDPYDVESYYAEAMLAYYD